MGGYGSASGKQEEFPKNLHDLYLIDYRNFPLPMFPIELKYLGDNKELMVSIFHLQPSSSCIASSALYV